MRAIFLSSFILVYFLFFHSSFVATTTLSRNSTKKSEKNDKKITKFDDVNVQLYEEVKKFSNNDTNNELNMILPYESHSSIERGLKCTACKWTVSYALWKYKKPDGTYPGLTDFIQSACKHLKIETDEVCDGIVNTFKGIVLTLLTNLHLTSEEVCGLILPSTCYSPNLPWNKIHWNVTIPGKLVPKHPNRSPATKPSKDKPTLKVLHLSDVHIDLNYKPGSAVDCNDPLCCRAGSTAGKGGRTAGYWGSLGYCDTPYWTLENLLQEVSKKSYDYVLWTGDLPAHNDWNQSRESQINSLFNLTQLFLKYFPKTPIYPCLGNHESFPVNSFPPQYVKNSNESISWLYSALRKAWSPWLPPAALEKVRESGCYTVLVKPGFRIVSLNMNYCNQQNWWMLIDPVDPNHELQWLVQILLNAEVDGEKVHIIGHIPPGTFDCLPIWSLNYYTIIDRFQSTVTAQFFGHTHSDEMELFYDIKTKKVPVNVAYIGPSVTTYYNMNPGYREYVIKGFHSGSSWSVLDHNSFILNLTKANNLPIGENPVWEFEYSAKDAYNLKDLSPSSWNNILQSWISGSTESESTFQKYYNNFYKSNPPKKNCNASCKKDLLCRMRSAMSGDSSELCADL